VKIALPIAGSPGSGRLNSAFLHSLAALCIALPALSIGLANVVNSYDDAYITYRYAYNFANGYGLVYNRGEYYLGTTGPGYGLLLGVLGALDPNSIPLISGWLSALALLATGIGLYAYGVRHRLGLSGFLAGLFFVVQPMVILASGGEMLFQAALIAWAFVAYSCERYRAAAILLACAVLVRPDALLAVVVVGLHSILVRRRIPYLEAMTLAAVLAPFLLAAWWYYGSPLPGTLGAKMAQGASGMWMPFYQGAMEWLRSWTIQGSSKVFTNPAAPNAIRYIWLICAGAPALWFYRSWLMPLAWVLLYAAVYSLIRAPFYHWYIVPLIFGLSIVAASGASGVVDGLRWAAGRAGAGRVRQIAMLGLPVLVCCALAPGVYSQMRFSQHMADGVPGVVERLYKRTGLWFKAHTSPQASVGYLEIGYMGFYAQRRMIDPVGLVNPGVAPHVLTRELTWAYEHYRPDYIVYNPDFFVPYLSKVVTEPWFLQEYREVGRMVEAQATPLVIYRRVAGGPIGERPAP
jgi:arabinofuranosyltransferase